MRRSYSHSEIVCIDSELATPLSDMQDDHCDDSIRDSSVEQQVEDLNLFLKDFADKFNRKLSELEDIPLSSRHIQTMSEIAHQYCLTTYESYISLLNSKLKK
jgi:hypothetical protein